jgi:hypothetical protein
MNSGQDLYLEMRDKTILLERALGELGDRGRANANAEREYKIALAKRILEYKAEKMPVTIIPDLCRGDIEVARLRFQRDVSKTVYKSALEAINIYKLNIRTLDEQMKREQSRSGT